jgi:hypothetical protein
MTRTGRILGGMAVTLLWGSGLASAQQDAANMGARLIQDAAIKSALDAIQAAEPQTIEDH